MASNSEMMEVEQSATPSPLPEAGTSGGGGAASSAAAPEAITYKVVTNDGKPESMELLVALKNIFAIQLPKMPREYIVRLVFDRKHKSLALCRDGVAIAGICYRPHYAQGFGEIAFCAVQGTQQVRGYGTMVMNALKEHGREEGLQSFLTFADGFALGYFRRLGFTRNPFVPRERREPFIKQYEGAVYMECYLHPTVDYLKTREMVAAQRDFVRERIAERSQMGVVYPGLESLRRNQLITNPIQQIPGIKEAGWTMEALRKESGREHAWSEAAWATLAVELEAALDKLEKEPFSWPFYKAVDATVVEDYYSVIKNPIDLETMRKRVRTGRYYRNVDMFRADLLRMARNCMTYNSPDTQFYTHGESLEKYVQITFPAMAATAAVRSARPP